jgi:two-component system sensor histidine kinase/response regulator
MGRVLVIISNSEVKKKIIKLSSKLKGSDFYFLTGTEDFADEFQTYQPDALIVGDKELRALGNNAAALATVNSVKKLILAGHDPKEPLTFQCQEPILLYPGFDIAEFEHLVTAADHEFNIQLLDTCKPLKWIFDNLPIGLFWKDLNLKYLGCNNYFAEDHGISDPETVGGLSDYDLAPKHLADEYVRKDRELINSGNSVFCYEETGFNKDGNPEVTWKRKILIRDDNGKVVGILGMYEKITDKRQREIELQEERRSMQMLMDNVPETIFFKDRNSQFVKVNKAWLKKRNLNNAEDVIGKTDADFFDAGYAGKTYQDEQALMQKGEPLFNMLESRIDASGHQHFKLANKVPLYDQNNVVMGMVGISHDITELKQAEFKLTIEKELLQSLMDNVPDTIYFKDTQSRFTQVNQAFAFALGLQSPDEAIGKNDFDFFPEEQAKPSYQEELEILKSGKPKINRIEKVKNADGKILWVSTTKFPVKDESGIVTGIIGISRDVTVIEEARSNLIYAKEKAEEANRAKSLFLANMSHEIRTPMNGVIGMADVLNQTVLTDEQHDYLNIITKSGNNLLSIINNILDFSKIESGSLELEKAPINIRQVIENVADVLIITASNKGVNLVNYVDSSIPEIVEGDALRLHQILLNLVNNALKFTAHGEVFFTAQLTDSTEKGYTILFKVKDSGIGIPKEAQQKIFQSFTQVDSTTTRKFGGTGLGLAISKRLVEMMEGNIGVESVEGEGSSFWFSARFGIGSEKELSMPTPKLLIDGLKVLIVDDNRTNRFVFGKYLDTWNCSYDQTDSGETALKMLIDHAEQDNAYDVALIDYQMEGMDGLKLAQLIQENSLISSTRLILLSSVTDVIPRSEVLSRGFNYFLNKPVKLNELYSVISSVTGNNEREKMKPITISDLFPSKLSVLVAEDNFTNLKVAQLILKPFVYVFESAENGLVAFEKFKTIKFDVIFMDVQMPVMNGYEATRKIRDYEMEHHLTPVKIVAMTAAAMKEDIEECTLVGMDNYLSKPFKRDDVIRIIKNLNI